MWILPKNYQLSSAFAADMVESKEDLTLPGLNIESSLMWRSKPSPLRTWLTRWKQGSYLPHLFTRILKPSQRTSFEIALTSSLAVIPASRFRQQDREREQMTQDTFGLLSGDTLNQLDLFSASLKTSRDTYRLDSPQSSAIWEKMVTEQRGEYSQRLKLAHLTREKESTSWPTVTVNGNYNRKGVSKTSGDGLATAVKNWPTPTAGEAQHAGKHAKGQMGQSLSALARRGELAPGEAWPSPLSRDYKGSVTSETLAAKGRNPMTNSLPDAVLHKSGPGYLNPEWVEWLMGVPTGWTELGCWEMQ